MSASADTPSSPKARGPLVVGLTGGIGSGKSTIGAAFECRGVAVIDADAIAHEVTAPGGSGIEPIRQAFGAEFITAGGAMDRDRMRAHVFADATARTRLEGLLHPLIRAETARRLAAARSPYALLMIPLLVEAAGHDPHWRSRFDRILVVDCSEATQVGRVMARNGFDEPAVRRIMAAQATRQERLAQSDDVINNDGGLAGIEPQVEVLHRKYLELAAARGP
jgi:dephospho-CoA kinase